MGKDKSSNIQIMYWKKQLLLRLDGQRQEFITLRTITEHLDSFLNLKTHTLIYFTNLGFALWLAKGILNNLQEIRNCSIH